MWSTSSQLLKWQKQEIHSRLFRTECSQVHQTEAAANAALVNAFVSAANSAVTSKGAFTVALSGGSMPASLAGLKDAKVSALE